MPVLAGRLVFIFCQIYIMEAKYFSSRVPFFTFTCQLHPVQLASKRKKAHAASESFCLVEATKFLVHLSKFRQTFHFQ